MKFNSTRGKVKGCTFEEALFSPGYQADGGLLLPETIPTLSKGTLKSWANLSFSDICKEFLSLFVSEDEIPRQDLSDAIDKAYARLEFPEVVHLAQLVDGLNILEMFHGPTLAFKDLSTFVVGQLMGFFLQKQKKHVTLLVGTSGDTGSSSIQAVKGVEGIDIVVLFPKGRISNIQERSMTTVDADNIHVFGVDGSSDDADVPIRSVSLDQEFRFRHNLGTVNSINIARVLCQAVSFFYVYFKLCPSCDGVVEIIAPSGAGGNVAGGVIASKMGLPVKLVCAVNGNDIIHRSISQGDFSRKEKVIPTLSPAIDIQNPYNLERILSLFSNNDCNLIRELFTKQETEGAVRIPDDLLQKVHSTLTSHGCTDDAVKTTMQRCWKENGYLLCPHTAVGVACYYHKLAQRAGENSQIKHSVVLATASPAKFPEAVSTAGLTPEDNPIVEKWLQLPSKETIMTIDQDWEEILRNKVEEITRRVEGL
ncbi:Threonine synthase-like 2 [Holothuria leucospilota]|uniref:Threonine synthase-like 2 n=1 Tax=Holothuria leucospilota TaxID=206669 RepID=A0A9Q0YQV0_HOLLE|nr:Threonine synthase-like 2 [Holothuria leucospilota]